jgi:hypothetical protein
MPSTGWCTVQYFLILCLLTFPALALESSCTECHQDKDQGQQLFHAFACIACHAGNNQAFSVDTAHQGLIPFPGNLSNAAQSCGQCHQGHVDSVKGHSMTTARGMVSTTRQVLGMPDDGADITELGQGLADSLLRKLCAGCHLGRDRDTHTHSTLNRGGGCLACHLDDYPASGHIRLTKNISDARCFGCHARSGRISLNYAGLAEIDIKHVALINKKARLPDGRLVQLRESDIHHQAGMSCIDCHTQNGLMGSSSKKGIDIQCTDCHQASPSQKGEFVTQWGQSRLQNVTESTDGIELRLKGSGQRIPVPQYNSHHHAYAKEHARLSCDACHTQWAPLCYGCHIEYDANTPQYDHLEKKETAGRWKEKRWMTLSDLPPLGVDANNHIRPFVPGMILTLNHPGLEKPLFRRLFAPLAPHTTGKARSCASCHCNPLALGLGSGKLTETESGWEFESNQPIREDGLAEDAWQHWNDLGKGSSTQPGARSLNAEEISNMLDADIECPSQATDQALFPSKKSINDSSTKPYIRSSITRNTEPKF